MAGNISVGLPFAPSNPNLTFIFFIALTLLAALSLRFSFYAYRNRGPANSSPNGRCGTR